MSIKKVLCVGGGVLGSQIALQTAYCGFDVSVLLISKASIERTKPKLARYKGLYLDTMEKMKRDKSFYCRGFTNKNNLTNVQIDNLKNRVEKAYNNIILTTSYKEVCKNADLVIESIAEDLQQKKEIYQNLAEYLPEKTIIATNSSTLLPSQLADSTGRPDKFLAFHFANYIWKSNTVEIMMHAKANPKYFDILVEFAKQINMVPLKVLKEQKGYILNTLLIPLLKSALYLWVNDISLPETIDKTWRLGTVAKRGPFEIMDIIGLNTLINIVSLNPNVKNPNSVEAKFLRKLKVMVDEGKLGINVGEGFYKYKK